MEIVRVKKEELKYFAGVAPVDVLGLMTLPNAAALGAVEDKDAVGILVFTKQGKESITIEWLYVDEEYRGMGAGAMLTEKTFDIAERLKVKRVCARLTQDDNFEAKQIYLMQWGFSWMKTLPGEWNITAKELFNLPFSKKVLKMKEAVPDVKPMSEISKKDLAKAVIDAEKAGANILYDVVNNGQYLDPDLSVVSTRNGKINGLFLMHKRANVIYPAVLWSKDNDPSIISRLFAGSLKYGEKSIKEKDTIRITANNDDQFAFEKKLINNIGEKTVYMMQASSDMLKKLGEETLNFKNLFMPADIPTGGFAVADVEVR